MSEIKNYYYYYYYIYILSIAIEKDSFLITLVVKLDPHLLISLIRVSLHKSLIHKFFIRTYQKTPIVQY